MSWEVVDSTGRRITHGTKVLYGGWPFNSAGIVRPGTHLWENWSRDPANEEYLKHYVGVVIEISEPDIDYDDERQGPRQFPPKVRITFDTQCVDTEVAGTYNDTKVGWADYPDGPAHEIFLCEDLDVIPT